MKNIQRDIINKLTPEIIDEMKKFGLPQIYIMGMYV